MGQNGVLVYSKVNRSDMPVEICTETGRWEIMTQVMKMTEKHLKYRAGADMEIGAVMYSNVYGILGKTDCAEKLIQEFCKSKIGALF